MEYFTDKDKPTILHLLSHRPNPVCLSYKTPEEYISKHDNAEFIRIKKYPYWVGFFEDFNHKIAIDTLNRTDKYNLECWRPYWSSIGKSYEKMFEGVLHKSFPSRLFKIPNVGNWLWSESYLNELKLRISRKEKILLHVHDGHSNFITWLLLKLKPMNVPVLYQHRGGWFSNFDFKFRRKNPVSFLTYKKHLEIFKYITHYLSGSRFEYDFLKNDLKIKNMSFFMDGVDFNYFTPGDKIAIRKKLNLPLDKKIILYVGRFDACNGVENLLKVFRKLKENNYNVELLLVGGYKQNSSYQLAKNAGAFLVERVQEPKLKDYYQAADIYSLAIDDYLYQTFGGFGTATIQALACGIPVLSYNIIHLPTSMEEINMIGRTFTSIEDLYQKMVYMLDNLNEFKNCRDISKKYYDKNETMRVLINKYDELLTQFYG
ncbi:MAG: glycosyltransferase family 4 protein [Ignavibacteriae bacterium]|nr:glycosyltransferase family 4 protein [Ignavibacteriota bacterium]